MAHHRRLLTSQSLEEKATNGSPTGPSFVGTTTREEENESDTLPGRPHDLIKNSREALFFGTMHFQRA